MPDNSIQSFFTDLRDTHISGVGVKETSYYPYLTNLLNALGKKLKPRVRCIIHPHSVGAGLPDGALITTDQKSSVDDPLASGMIPARGVIEIKDPSADAQATAQSEQVTKYLDKYGLVLVTNLRQYILMARIDGQPKQLESFTLASTAKTFWKALDNPAEFTDQVGASFVEYLMRVLLQKAPLSTPKEGRLVSRFVCARCQGPHRRPAEPAGTRRAAVRTRRSARPGVYRGRRRAFLPLIAGADIVLWHLLGLGVVEQAPDDRPER